MRKKTERERAFWHWCPQCGKRAWELRKGARQFLRLKAGKAKMREYRACEAGFWHIGHLPRNVHRGSITAPEIYNRRDRVACDA